MSRFTAYGNRHMRRAGAAGRSVEVAVEHGRVVLTGRDGVPVVWPIAAIARIRVGYDESKSARYYQTMLWQIGETRPIVIAPDRANLGAYAATIRTLASEIAGARGLAHVERGIGGIGALILPLLIGLLLLAELDRHLPA